MQVDVQLSLTILMCLSNLERVNLLSIEETNNQHLIDLSNNLPHLQHLKVTLLAFVSDSKHQFLGACIHKLIAWQKD